ncbi:MAG: helix-turn-helix domain-containing protein [Spirochaetaceae bacterium]
MSEPKNLFLVRLQQTLERKGVRRPWLAKETGIPLSTINTWFSYRRSPRLDEAAQIAEALEVNLDWLVTGRGTHSDFPDETRRTIVARLHDMSEGKARLTLLFCEFLETVQEDTLPDSDS